jgi:L-threonylcarbamoyladenylate synthase
MHLLKSDSEGAITQAAEIICRGGLVAFPTETVYGLGANAFDPQAVAKIYAAKGRPGDNPLILHIANTEEFTRLADDPSPYAQALIKEFWPGPLTLVVKKKPQLPPWLGKHPSMGTTETIGIRFPSHEITREIMEKSKCVIAAPSANKAGTPSPTCAAHVESDFSNQSSNIIDLILDGGPVSVGLESTVVDVTGDSPIILRPGAITETMIRRAIGLDILHDFQAGTDSPRAPGMKYRHYAPRGQMTIVTGQPGDIQRFIIAKIMEKIREEPPGKVGILATTQTVWNYGALATEEVIHSLTVGDQDEPSTIAKNLFSCLRRFDELGVDVIYAEGIQPTLGEGLGEAIMDRMIKAAEGRVIYAPTKA